MKHSVDFEDGRVEFNLLPAKVVADIADASGGAVDTSQLTGDALRKVMQLLDGYVVTVVAGDVGQFDTISECPLPWGMYALEAVMDFCFPAQKSKSDTSPPAASGASPTAPQEASTPSTTSS